MHHSLLLASIALLSLTTVALFAWMFLYYALLKRIKRAHPKYYQKLGRPFLPQPNRHMTAGIERDRANYRFMRDICKGIPKGFPNDTVARRQAGWVRLSILLSVGLLLADVPVYIATLLQ